MSVLRRTARKVKWKPVERKRRTLRRIWFSLTELGREYGVSAYIVGLWLIELGYRNDGMPTARALNEGVACKPTTFTTWNIEKLRGSLEALNER